MQQLIGAISHSVPTALREVITLGRTLKRRAVDMLAYFDRPGSSNGPTEAINGRLEHLRGSALGFRNLTNYIARSLLETGGFRPDYTLDHEEPRKWRSGWLRCRSGVRVGYQMVHGSVGQEGFLAAGHA